MSARRLDRKPARKAEAIARNTAWAELSLTTKLDRLHQRRGFSQAQRNRLMAPMTAKIAAKVAAKAAAAAQVAS